MGKSCRKIWVLFVYSKLWFVLQGEVESFFCLDRFFCENLIRNYTEWSIITSGLEWKRFKFFCINVFFKFGIFKRIGLCLILWKRILSLIGCLLTSVEVKMLCAKATVFLGWFLNGVTSKLLPLDLLRMAGLLHIKLKQKNLFRLKALTSIPMKVT